MFATVPEPPQASLEVRILRIATENLLELQIEGAPPEDVELELDTALECRGELTVRQMLALLLRNLVERLLLLDQALATDLARFEDLTDRARIPDDPRPRGTGLLRRLADRALDVAGEAAEPLQALFLPGSDGESAWERALVLPGSGAPQDRAEVLADLGRMLALDPDVLSRLAPPRPRSRVPRFSARPFPRPAVGFRRPPTVRREARLGSSVHELGDRVLVALNPEGAAAELRPVVVREVAGDAEVVFPTAANAWPDLGRFSRSDAGYEIPLNLSAPAGTHRYLVALVPEGMDIDWDAPESSRWQPVRDGIEAGHFEAEDFEVEVSGRAPRASLAIAEQDSGWRMEARVDGVGALGGLGVDIADAVQRRLRAVQDTLTVSMSLGLAREENWAEAEEEIGRGLFEAATANPQLWRGLGGALRGRAAAGRLDLDLTGSRLQALPWELIAGGAEGGPVGLREGWSVTRRTRGVGGTARGGLEVFGVAHPDDLPGLGPALADAVAGQSPPGLMVLDIAPSGRDMVAALSSLADASGLRLVAPRRGWTPDLADAFIGTAKARLVAGAAPVDAAAEGRRSVAALRQPGPGNRWHEILVFSPR